MSDFSIVEGDVTLRKSDGTEIGVAGAPVRTDPTGTTAQPVTVASLPLPAGAATEATVAAINTATGATADADTALTVIGRLKQLLTRLPAALVGGRLDTHVGSWLGSTAPTVGQKATSGSIPVVLPSDQIVPVSSAATEEATFTVVSLATTFAADKSLISLYNPVGSTKVLKLREYYARNAQTANVTGVAAQIQALRFAVVPTGGTALTVATHDTNDVLGAGILASTNATVSADVAGVLDIMRVSTDEWGPGTLDLEGAQQTIANYLPARVKRDAQQKPIAVLRAGQGFRLRSVTAAPGTFDFILVFTQV